MPIVASVADLVIAANRLATGMAAQGIPHEPPDARLLAYEIKTHGDIIAIRGTTGVLWAHYDRDLGRWYVTHLYGLTKIVRRGVCRDLADELRLRGEGLRKVRWTRTGAVAKELADALGLTLTADGEYESDADLAVTKI